MTQPRILLVDDEYSGTEVLSLILREEGFEVTAAGDAQRALALLPQVQPDLLVTDFMMPGMNGADLARAVRAQPAFEHLPVLLMSGAPASLLREHADAYDAFLRKPFGMEQFIEQVRSLLARRTG